MKKLWTKLRKDWADNSKSSFEKLTGKTIHNHLISKKGQKNYRLLAIKLFQNNSSYKYVDSWTAVKATRFWWAQILKKIFLQLIHSIAANLFIRLISKNYRRAIVIIAYGRINSSENNWDSAKLKTKVIGWKQKIITQIIEMLLDDSAWA